MSPHDPEDTLRTIVQAREEQRVVVRYCNHRGEVALRTITPLGVAFGHSEWHGSPQEPVWLLQCWDWGKDAQRTYLLADCDFTS